MPTISNQSCLYLIFLCFLILYACQSESLKDAAIIVGGIMTNLNDLINDIISDASNLVNKAIQNIGLSNECVKK